MKKVTEEASLDWEFKLFGTFDKHIVVLATLFGSTQIEDELVLIPSCHISLDEPGVYLLFEKKNTR